MNKCKWLLCALMTLTFTAGAVMAQDAAKPKKKKARGRSALRGEYAVMASELKFTDAQKTKMIETIQAQRDAKKANAQKVASLKKEFAEARKPKDAAKVKELTAKGKELQKELVEARKPANEAKAKELAAKIKELQKELAEARKPKDAAKVKELTAKGKELQKELVEARKPADQAKVKELAAKIKELQSGSRGNRAALMAILTDDQKKQWGSFNIYRNVCRRFGKAKLTDDQKKAVRELCSSAKPAGDKKAAAANLKALTDKVTADILTNEQRQKMVAKPKARKPRAKKKPADK